MKKQYRGGAFVKKKLLIFFICTLLLVNVMIYQKTDLKEETISTYAILVDGKEEKEIPSKNSGYILANTSSCNNGASISWDEETWSPVVNLANQTANENRMVCTLHFEIDQRRVMIPMTMGNTNETYSQNGKYIVDKIILQNQKSNITGSVETVDFSIGQDETVVGQYVPNGTNYTLYIQADGKIKANPNASYYFSNKNGTSFLVEGLENLDTTLVEDMSYMFNKYQGTGLDLSNWNVENVKTMYGMFFGSNKVTTLNLANWNTKSLTNMALMFTGMSELTSLEVNHFDVSKVTLFNNMFSGMKKVVTLDLSNWETTEATDMHSMFNLMENLISLNISRFNTSKVLDMQWMFKNCSSLTSLDVTNFNTQKVTNMLGMFFGLKKLTTLDLSHFDTSNVKNFEGMFWNSEKLTTLDLSNFQTAQATNLHAMFRNMQSLTSLDISNFDTNSVTTMDTMFAYTPVLSHITYGTNFVYKTGMDITGIFDDCPANKPTDSSWNGMF